MHRQPGRRVPEVVAVIHPDAWVAGAKRDHVALARMYVQGVRPPRTARGRDAVAAEDEHVVSVEVHRMDSLRVVRDRDLDEVALLNDEHGHVRVDLAVDRPLEPRSAVEEAGFAGDRELEAT